MSEPSQTAPAFRRTTQALMPAVKPRPPEGGYDLYPSFALPAGSIGLGWEAFAAGLPERGVVALDGMPGVLWNQTRGALSAALMSLGRNLKWLDAGAAWRDAAELEALAAPHLGGDDPLFGFVYDGPLNAFFEPERLEALSREARRLAETALVIISGPGAALIGADLTAFLDLPKNEAQFRARAGVPTNLGLSHALGAKPAYKRSFFLDWPALRRHQAAICAELTWIVDAQRPLEPAFASGDTFRAGLRAMAGSWLRARPWFEPGPWGGQWLKQLAPQLPEAPNYAWSFELISPENGLLFSSDGLLLEVSFDWLMLSEAPRVLGQAEARFGASFPIRFDHLDTMGGGNLSLQCHPRPAYMKEHFNEPYTQDETYYILDATPDATVFMGFQEGVNEAEFRAALEDSQAGGAPVDVQKFVRLHPARRGDLFLLPGGTVHCSGVGNLVLEISATPYIFTFKMYDWQRLDLDGNPRPINLERAFANLIFERQGRVLLDEHISHPRLLQAGEGWRTEHLPTHRSQFFDVQRHTLSTPLTVSTLGQAHVINVVQGPGVLLTAGGRAGVLRFAETAVIPAAAGEFTLSPLLGPTTAPNGPGPLLGPTTAPNGPGPLLSPEAAPDGLLGRTAAPYGPRPLGPLLGPITVVDAFVKPEACAADWTPDADASTGNPA